MMIVLARVARMITHLGEPMETDHNRVLIERGRATSKGQPAFQRLVPVVLVEHYDTTWGIMTRQGGEGLAEGKGDYSL